MISAFLGKVLPCVLKTKAKDIKRYATGSDMTDQEKEKAIKDNIVDEEDKEENKGDGEKKA